MQTALHLTVHLSTRRGHNEEGIESLQEKNLQKDPLFHPGVPGG
jgi:hypothetical protein